MSEKPIYHMSGVGSCPKALTAERLGNAPAPQSKEDIDKLNHYTRCEILAGMQIEDEFTTMDGKVINAGLCDRCQEEQHIGRAGIHTEIETTLFRLIGHMDRQLILPNMSYIIPIEIKSLGKSSFTRFKNKQFSEFTEYAYQECCYLHNAGGPGLYWIMNRDSGENLKYTVNDDKGLLSFLGYQNLTLPVTFEEIVDRLNQIEIEVSYGTLPAGDAEKYDCYFCRYSYLCEKKEEKAVSVVSDSQILSVGQQYREAMEMEEAAKEQKDVAKNILQNFAIKNNLSKYKMPGLSVTYNGMKTKKTLDLAFLRKEVSPEIIKLAEREGEPYPDCIIRRLKQ